MLWIVVWIVLTRGLLRHTFCICFAFVRWLESQQLLQLDWFGGFISSPEVKRAVPGDSAQAYNVGGVLKARNEEKSQKGAERPQKTELFSSYVHLPKFFESFFAGPGAAIE